MKVGNWPPLILTALVVVWFALALVLFGNSPTVPGWWSWTMFGLVVGDTAALVVAIGKELA